MFCSRKMVPPGSVMRLRLVANSLAAIGNELVRMSRSEFSRNSTSAKVVVPPLMMMLSPGDDELGRGARDRPLLRHAHVLAHGERHADQMRLMPRAHRFGAAANSLHLAPLGERVDVAPDGGFGRPEQIEQVTDAHDGALIDELQNQVMAFFFQHGVTLDLRS